MQWKEYRFLGRRWAITETSNNAKYPTIFFYYGASSGDEQNFDFTKSEMKLNCERQENKSTLASMGREKKRGKKHARENQ